MEDVYYLNIENTSGSFEFLDEDIAEEWGESYFIRNGAVLSAVFRGDFYEDIRSVSFRGNSMESRDLEVWIAWEGVDKLKAEIQRFGDHQGLNILIVEVPNPESKLVSVVRARGEVPDVVMIHSGAVSSLIEAGALQSLGYVYLPHIIEQGREAFSLNGSLWGMPFYFDTQVVFFNRNLVPHPPRADWTLADMEALAEDLSGRNIYPLVWNAYAVNWLIPFQLTERTLFMLRGWIRL